MIQMTVVVVVVAAAVVVVVVVAAVVVVVAVVVVAVVVVVAQALSQWLGLMLAALAERKLLAQEWAEQVEPRKTFEDMV